MNLYEHQQRIISENPPRALIALGTGGGKTRVCLELAEGATLIVCPKQQRLDRTWEENAGKFGLVVNLTVMSKEEFKRDAAKLGGFETVIFDECHTILGVTTDTKIRGGVRTPKTSQLYQSARDFIERTNPKRLYLASATPVTKPMHLWALATLFGKKWDYFKFRETFYIPRRMGFREIWIPKSGESVKIRLANLTKSFGFTGQLSDWFDVPEQKHETIYVELTQEQSSAIQKIKMEEADPLAVRARIRTIENGILYGMDIISETDRESRLGRKTIFYDSNKLREIYELSKNYSKVLIFAAYTAQIDDIAGYCRRNGKVVFTLKGDTKDRGNVIKEAENSEEGIVVAQASISSGYELPSFPCVIFASKSYRYVDYEQALGRVLRANAIKKNFYYHLVVKGGVDEDCHKAIMSGQDFQERVMENI